MGDFPHYFDIILFAMVAAFLILRLRSVLGRRTGQERRPDTLLRRGEPAAADKVVALGNRAAAATAPFPLRFRPPLRFIGREIVVLPIDPHGPIRALHERLKASGLPHEVARWPFTPHCTLSYYPTLTEESLRSLLTVRADEEWTLHALRVYHTRELQPPRLLFDVPLGGAGARAAG